MPNHITNIITLKGNVEQINDCINKYSTKYPATIYESSDGKFICKKDGDGWNVGWLDTNTGTFSRREKNDRKGLPKGWEVQVTQGVFAFPDFKKVIPPPDDPAYNDEPSQDVAEKSPFWWYTWNCKYWGSKWGGYSYQQLAINTFQFDTAWSSVPKIIEVISLEFPELIIEYMWADEDIGGNVGEIIVQGGDIISDNIPESCSNEAYELVFKIKPETKEWYELIDGEYQNKED